SVQFTGNSGRHPVGVTREAGKGAHAKIRRGEVLSVARAPSPVQTSNSYPHGRGARVTAQTNPTLFASSYLRVSPALRETHPKLDAPAQGFYNIAMIHVIAQAPAAGGPTATTIFCLTLLFIFLTAIVTTLVTKWSRDKCLKLFHRYHVTLERGRGQTIWGTLKVFSNGLEIMFDHAYTDTRGRRKTSYMLYQPEVEQQVLSIVRFHDELDATQQAKRQRQIRKSFNPGPIRRMWRGVRNLVNTLRDAFGQAIGAAVGQFQRLHPTAALGTQASHVTQIGQVLVGKFGNAYEPLLEQYIGQPVILDV